MLLADDSVKCIRCVYLRLNIYGACMMGERRNMPFGVGICQTASKYVRQHQNMPVGAAIRKLTSVCVTRQVNTRRLPHVPGGNTFPTSTSSTSAGLILVLSRIACLVRAGFMYVFDAARATQHCELRRSTNNPP